MTKFVVVDHYDRPLWLVENDDDIKAIRASRRWGSTGIPKHTHSFYVSRCKKRVAKAERDGLKLMERRDYSLFDRHYACYVIPEPE